MPRCLPSGAGLMETVNFTVPPALPRNQPPLMMPPLMEPKSRASGSHLNSSQSAGPKLHALTINFQFEPPGSFPRHCFFSFCTPLHKQRGMNFFSTQLVRQCSCAEALGLELGTALWAAAGRWAPGTRKAIGSKPHPPQILTNSRSSPEQSPLARSVWPVGSCTPNLEARRPGAKPAPSCSPTDTPAPPPLNGFPSLLPAKCTLKPCAQMWRAEPWQYSQERGAFLLLCPGLSLTLQQL